MPAKGPKHAQREVRRSSRITRSQSQDLEQPNSEARRRIRASRSQSLEIEDDELKRESVGKAPTKRKTSTAQDMESHPDRASSLEPHDLPAIDEAPEQISVTADNGNQQLSSPKPEPQLATADLPERSQLSGTTARISGSAQDLQDSTFDAAMLEPLADLGDAAVKLLTSILPKPNLPHLNAQLYNIIQDAIASRAMKQPPQHDDARTKFNQLTRHSLALTRTLSQIIPVDSEDTFLHLPRSESSLQGAEHTLSQESLYQSPDPISRLTNLAILTTSTLRYPKEIGENFLSDADRVFPNAFVKIDLDKAGSSNEDLYPATFQLALEIRTQHAIAQLEANASKPNFDHDVIIRQIFYADDDGVRGWNWTELRTGDLTNSVRKQILARVVTIRDIARSMSGNANRITPVQRLKARFLWSDCAASIITWIQNHYPRVSAEIADAGGQDKVVKSIHRHLNYKDVAGEDSMDRRHEAQQTYGLNPPAPEMSNPLTSKPAILLAKAEGNRSFSSFGFE